MKLGAQVGKNIGSLSRCLNLFRWPIPKNMDVLYALAKMYSGKGDIAVKLAAGSSKAANWTAAVPV